MHLLRPFLGCRERRAAFLSPTALAPGLQTDATMQHHAANRRGDDLSSNDPSDGLDRMAPTQHDPLFTRDPATLGRPGPHTPLLLKRGVGRSITGLAMALLLFAVLATIAFVMMRQLRTSEDQNHGPQGEGIPNAEPANKTR